MLAKLAFRNVKRSAKDYLVYFLTMTFVTAMMFAFNTVIFSADLQGRVSDVDMMQVLIILATMFLKQHSVIDVAAAIVMAYMLYQFFYAPEVRRYSQRRPARAAMLQNK